jgi:lysophospholipase L1-like esterase
MMLVVVAAPFLFVLNAGAAHPVTTPPAMTGTMVVLGDSYSVGYDGPSQKTTRSGPFDQMVPLARKRGWNLKLVNFGCAGATTASMMSTPGCRSVFLAPGAKPYPTHSQYQAALSYIKTHPHQVKVLAVEIGINDVDTCIVQKSPLGCIDQSMPTAVKNLATMLGRLRAAGGADMRIIGVSYPDFALGAWVRHDLYGTSGPTVAVGSLAAFHDQINPGLATAYRTVNGSFVDVTAATGAYGAFVAVHDPPYGTIPKPVATVCNLTRFCGTAADRKRKKTRAKKEPLSAFPDLHMTLPGYGVVGALAAKTLPDLSSSARR